MAERSRLSRKIERQSKKNLILSLFGIIVILFLLFKIGIPALVNFVVFISGLKGNQETISPNKTNEFISPPTLNSTFNATNSARISLSGVAQENQTIKLYVNDEVSGDTQTKKDGLFSFDNVKLSKGENIVKTKAFLKDNKESEFSKALTVFFKDGLPKLEINNPSDNQNFSKDENNIKVSGKTDPNVNVTVNGYIAIVDEKGNFSYQLPLENGENKIKIMAVDEAGNKTEAERKVNYSQ